jgi:putative transposase
VVLRREGFLINHKRTERIYRSEKLNLRIRRRKKFASVIRTPLPEAVRVNQLWAMDFVSDSLWTGRRFRSLTLVDTFTKESLGIEVDTSLTGQRVVRVLERLSEMRGLPEYIRVDNGPEFISKALDEWAYRNKVKLDFIRPGKPTENAYIESFNGRFRDECLNENYFIDLNSARQTIEKWRIEYNTYRPHSSLNDLTPEAFARMNKETLTQNTQELYLSVA